MEIQYENRTSNFSYILASALSPVIHMHKELELIHVLEGSTVAHADTKSYILNAGDTFLAFPYQIHYYNCNTTGKFIICIFSEDCIYNFQKTISGKVPECNTVLMKDEPQLSELAQATATVAHSQHNMILNGYINIMLGHMLSHLSLTDVHAENTDALAGIMKYCSQNFKDPITLDTISQDLHLSKYYISHLINKKIGQNFNEYLNKLRIGEACLLLRETDKKIADISEDVGFGSLRSFNRAFKHIMGITPIAYREQHILLKNALV